VLGNNQGAQALGIAYGLFEPGEEPAAVEKLVQLIQTSDGHMDCGVLAGRVIFHVLAQHGYAELAYHMIVREDAPSYGHWVVHENCTALFESFRRTSEKYDGSKNHHFWGDISNWFFRYIAGVKINPHARDVKELEISPVFLEDLTYGGGYHILPAGRVEVRWERTEVMKKVIDGQECMEGIRLTLTIPQGCRGWLKLPDGFCTRDAKDRFLVAAERLTPGTSVYDVVRLYH